MFDNLDMSLEAADRLALSLIASAQPARMVRLSGGRVRFVVECPTCGREVVRGAGAGAVGADGRTWCARHAAEAAAAEPDYPAY